MLPVGFLYDEIADPWSLATRRDVEALIAERSRPADGRSRAYPPFSADVGWMPIKPPGAQIRSSGSPVTANVNWTHTWDVAGRPWHVSLLKLGALIG